MKLRLMLFAGAAAMMAAACSNEDEVAVNPDPRGDALTFSTSVGHSRATATTIDNLGDFHVVAKGIHPDGHIYDNFLIGSANGGDIAKKNGTSNIWMLEKNVYWPTSTSKAVFWAYTFAQTSGKTNVLPDGVQFSFDFSNAGKAQLTGFSPVKNALVPQAGEYNQWNDGTDQTDMLVALTLQDRATNASNVKLQFNHALSQVRIQAKSDSKAETDHRIVKIKGAWLVNAKDKADFTTTYKWNETESKEEVANQWENLEFKSDNFSAYGSFFRTPVVLGRKGDSDYASNPKTLVNESLMLIPQKLEAWNKNQNSKGEVDTNNGGAYILLLCRVELKHDGAYHQTPPSAETGGSGTKDEDIKVKGDKHYHQQFPVSASNKFNDAEYGFVCVPVATKFEMGKNYLFTLDICGATSGAGNYPPDLNDEFKKLVPKASGDATKYDPFKPWTDVDAINLEIVDRAVKKVGDPVLDAPIQFEVSVTPWPNDWTPGNAETDDNPSGETKF